MQSLALAALLGLLPPLAAQAGGLPAPNAEPRGTQLAEVNDAPPGLFAARPLFGFWAGIGAQGGARFPSPIPWAPRPVQPDSRQQIGYRGFRIDLGGVGPVANVANDVASAEHQIDIVSDAGLSPADMKLFRQFPILIANGPRPGFGGHYGGGPVVTIGNLLATDPRPVLLHQYMHVYEVNVLPGGVENPTVRQFYVEAVDQGLYAYGSSMLSDQSEFFAMTASCFLNGTVSVPPYNRATIRMQQPAYYAYLQRLFHTRRSQPSHVAALSRRGNPVRAPAVAPKRASIPG